MHANHLPMDLCIMNALIALRRSTDFILLLPAAACCHALPCQVCPDVPGYTRTANIDVFGEVINNVQYNVQLQVVYTSCLAIPLGMHVSAAATINKLMHANC